MQLSDIIKRARPPEPWSEGDKIPWNEAGFSTRMLEVHLDQANDLASRRGRIIQEHVAWIHADVLGGAPSDVLDLGCGPGFYVRRLAQLGHRCTGVDFGPASIAYAREQAAASGLSCRYIESDMRRVAELSLGQQDLVMLVYGEFNVFKRSDALVILRSAHQLLRPGGKLLIEPHTLDFVREMGARSPGWYSQESGIFGENPHLVLSEAFWDEQARLTTDRHYTIDAATAEVTRYVVCTQGYSNEEYAVLLAEAGFSAPRQYAGLAGDGGPVQHGLIALLASVL